MEDEELSCHDFTCMSELEVFIARLEDIIQDWFSKADCFSFKSKSGAVQWLSKHTTIDFTHRTYDLYFINFPNHPWQEDKILYDESFLQALHEVAESDYFKVTGSQVSHPYPYHLARWYGLNAFYLLSPNSHVVESENQIKLLMSSIYIATNNTNCTIPFFLEAKSRQECYYVGVCQLDRFHIDYEMVHLERTPPHCQYLSGLMTLFKGKIGAGITSPLTLCVNYEYMRNHELTQVSHKTHNDKISEIPFGVTSLNCELNLNVTWPNMVETAVVDTVTYSDLDPLYAPLWTATVKFDDNFNCLLADCFNEFLELCDSKQPIHSLLPSLFESVDNKLLRKDKFLFGSTPESNLMDYLFPNQDLQSKSPYPDFGKTKTSDEPTIQTVGGTARLNEMKSCPNDSLPWRLATAMMSIVHSNGGIKSIAHIWFKFTEALRFCWESLTPVPGVEPSYPDPKSCLLYQKLQLLNYCITKRIEDESRGKSVSDSDSDAEFFDCSSHVDELQAKTEKDTPTHQKPSGRLRRHGELRLLETGEYLYVPKTQDPVPKTEDQLDEDAEALLNLGTDAKGSELRARLMSASLLRDMEAFKAANPGCILADFIRWYSPRDWIEEEGLDEFGQSKGHLSHRMNIPKNIWLEIWELAKPVPSKWQTRLFNDVREAEKVLNFLEQQSPKGFFQLLAPVASTCVIHKLMKESEAFKSEEVNKMITNLARKTESLQKAVNLQELEYKALINYIYPVESTIMKINYLQAILVSSALDTEMKLRELSNLAVSLVTNTSTEILGDTRSVVKLMMNKWFSRDESEMQEQLTRDLSPSKKRVLLRCTTEEGPQRLYAELSKREFRLCGSFRKDDIFY